MNEKLKYFLALGFVFTFISFLYVYKIEPLESFSLKFNDIQFSLHEKKLHDQIILIAIDEPSIHQLGRWPWSREELAKGINYLQKADIVLFDMVFSETTTLEQDNKLAESIRSLNNSVCGFFLKQTSRKEVDESKLHFLEDSSLEKLQFQVSKDISSSFLSTNFAQLNVENIASSCTMHGSFSTMVSSDNLYRSYPIAFYLENRLYPSISIQGLRIKYNSDIEKLSKNSLKLDQTIFYPDQKGFIRLNYYDKEQYKTISFIDLLEDKFNKNYFANKIVILGVTDEGSGNIISTPIGQIPSSFIHYTFLSNFLQNHLIKEGEIFFWLIMILMLSVPFISILLFKKRVHRFFMNAASYISTYIIIQYVFIHFSLYIDLFYPLLTLILSASIIEAIAFNSKEYSEKLLTETFSSYLSKELLHQIIINPSSLKLGGETREVSILFSDIRNFTALSESMNAKKVVHLLNRYFSPMTQSVLNHEGMLDKYIGDAIMAFFNAPIALKNHANASCFTALSMIQELNKLNKQLKKESQQTISIGIGINTSNAVVGNIGSDVKKNYTVIGDGVNLASRIEDLTKFYGVQILISEYTFSKLTEPFLCREIEAVQVKGKHQSVLLYELMLETTENIHLVDMYSAALAAYKKEEFTKSSLLFEKIVKIYNDGPSKYFLNNIQNKKPWGIHIMTS